MYTVEHLDHIILLWGTHLVGRHTTKHGVSPQHDSSCLFFPDEGFLVHTPDGQDIRLLDEFALELGQEIHYT